MKKNFFFLFILISIGLMPTFGYSACDITTCEPSSTQCTPQPTQLHEASGQTVYGTDCCCHTSCKPSATYNGTNCVCKAGTYKDGNECKSCPNGYTSPEGSTAIGQCTKSCVGTNKPGFTIGFWGPDADTVSAPNDCEYTNPNNVTSCNNPTSQNGYHIAVNDPEATAAQKQEGCLLNNKDCNPGNGTGKKYWKNADNIWGACTITGCNNFNSPDGFHYFYNSSNSTGSCTKNRQPCNSSIEIGLNGYAQGGEAIWSGSSYNYGSWNKTTCYQSSDFTTNNGAGRETCYWRINYIFDNCNSYQMTRCNLGYYYDSTNLTAYDCVPTKPGYYSDVSTGRASINQKPCPIGTTSGFGTTNENSCYRVGGANGTRYCDDNGCFYLPHRDNIFGVY